MGSEIGSLTGTPQHGQQGGTGHQWHQGLRGGDGAALVVVAEHGKHTDDGKNSR